MSAIFTSRYGTDGFIRVLTTEDSAFTPTAVAPSWQVGKIEGWHDPTKKYVVDGQIVDRPANPTQLTGLQLTQVPVPSKLKVENKVYDVIEPTVDLSFAYPGTYTVMVESFPHLDVKFTVTV